MASVSDNMDFSLTSENSSELREADASLLTATTEDDMVQIFTYLNIGDRARLSGTCMQLRRTLARVPSTIVFHEDKLLLGEWTEQIEIEVTELSGTVSRKPGLQCPHTARLVPHAPLQGRLTVRTHNDSFAA